MAGIKKLNVEKALKAKMAGQTYQQIADVQHVHKDTVYAALKPILNQLPDVAALAEMKRTMADHFGVTAYRSVAAITDEKLQNASAKDLGILAGISIQNQRLIDGQSTSNSSIMLKAVMDAWQPVDSTNTRTTDPQVVDIVE